MASRRYTIVCDFRNGTYISQVVGNNVDEATQAWIELLVRDRPLGRSSTYLAKSVAKILVDDPPVPLNGLKDVWCVSAVCGGDLMLTNIIESVI